jgi:hypothetical protein
MDLGWQMIEPLNDAFGALTMIIKNTPPPNVNIHNEDNFDFLDEMEFQAIGDVPTNDDDLHPRKDYIYFITFVTKIEVPLYHTNQFFKLISTLMILCRNLSLGLVIKARAYKVTVQKGSQGVTSHAFGSAK